MQNNVFFPFLLVVFIQIVGSQSSWAQTKLSGTVKDSLDQAVLERATVTLINEKDSVIAQVMTNESGKYAFSAKAPGKYRIKAQYMGYKMRQLPVTFGPQPGEQTLDVLLPLDAIELEGVEITAVPPVILKGDTTEFDARAYTTEPYADADALLAQLPGVQIDEDGNLIAQGEQVSRIIVDGKEFFSTDPRIAMKTLPADIISKIQVIDERSEQSRFTGFDDGERSKVINIVTKPDRRHGYFGRVAAAYGNLERYNTGGHINFFQGDQRLSVMGVSNNVNQRNFAMIDMGGMGGMGGGMGGRGRGRRGGGRGMAVSMMAGGGGGFGGGGIPGESNTQSIALNYNDRWFDKLEIGGDYAFNYTNSLVSTLTNRETLIGNNANQISVSNSDNDNKNQSHRLGLRMEYDIDSTQQMTFSPSFSYQTTRGISHSLSSTGFKDGEPINTSNRDQQNTRDNVNISGDFNYRKRLGKPGRTVSLNIDASLNSDKGLAQTLSLSEYYEDYVLGRADTVNNKNTTVGSGNGITGRLAYTEPLGEWGRFQVNYSVRNTSNYSDRATFDFLAATGQFSELNRQLSNTFNNDYIHHSGGLTYQFSKETLHADIGLDFQGSNILNHKTFPEEERLTHSFQSFLPNASFSYRPSEEVNLRFQYNSGTNPPAISQLQDVINNEDPLNIRTGNAALDKEFQHRFGFNFNKVNRETGANFNANVNAEFTNNRVVNSTYIATADSVIAPGIVLGKGGQFTKPVNVDGYYTLRGNVSWGMPIKALKLNVNSNTGIHHSHDIGLMNGEKTYSDSYGINQRIGFNSRINERLIINASYSGNYTIANNSLSDAENYNYFNQTMQGEVTWIFWKGIRINSAFVYNQNSGLSQDYNQSFVTWNASIGKKLFKKQQAEIALVGYDLLNSSTNVSRSISDMYITDSSSNMLQQYFMLSFTYNLRNFGGGFPGFERRGRRHAGGASIG